MSLRLTTEWDIFLWSAFLDTQMQRGTFWFVQMCILSWLYAGKKAKRKVYTNQIELDKSKAYVEDRYPFPVQPLHSVWKYQNCLTLIFTQNLNFSAQLRP